MKEEKITTKDLLDAMKSGFDSIDDRFDKVDKRFDKIEARTDKMNSCLDRIDGHLTNIKTSMITKNYLDNKLADFVKEFTITVCGKNSN